MALCVRVVVQVRVRKAEVGGEVVGSYWPVGRAGLLSDRHGGRPVETMNS